MEQEVRTWRHDRLINTRRGNRFFLGFISVALIIIVWKFVEKTDYIGGLDVVFARHNRTFLTIYLSTCVALAVIGLRHVIHTIKEQRVVLDELERRDSNVTVDLAGR